MAPLLRLALCLFLTLTLANGLEARRKRPAKQPSKRNSIALPPATPEGGGPAGATSPAGEGAERAALPKPRTLSPSEALAQARAALGQRNCEDAALYFERAALDEDLLEEATEGAGAAYDCWWRSGELPKRRGDDAERWIRAALAQSPRSPEYSLYMEKEGLPRSRRFRDLLTLAELELGGGASSATLLRAGAASPGRGWGWFVRTFSVHSPAPGQSYKLPLSSGATRDYSILTTLGLELWFKVGQYKAPWQEGFWPPFAGEQGSSLNFYVLADPLAFATDFGLAPGDLLLHAAYGEAGLMLMHGRLAFKLAGNLEAVESGPLERAGLPFQGSPGATSLGVLRYGWVVSVLTHYLLPKRP